MPKKPLVAPRVSKFQQGNIRKRKDGSWEGRYTAGHDLETGKTVYKNVLGKIQAEVKKKLKVAIEESSTLDPAEEGQYTVGQWLKDYAKLSICPSSYKTYQGFIEHRQLPLRCYPDTRQDANAHFSKCRKLDDLSPMKAIAFAAICVP